MSRHLLTDQRGISLLLILIMVAVVGLSAAVAGSTWQTIMQRSREAELLFRGDQYRRAIESYFKAAHGGQLGQFPIELEQLLRDPRFPGSKRHIRQLYRDPMTGEEFEVIRNPLAGGGIKGVRSRSTREPFKQDGFSAEYETFRGATSYQAWEFVFEPPRVRRAPGVQLPVGGQLPMGGQSPGGDQLPGPGPEIPPEG